MNSKKLRAILNDVAAGRTPVGRALKEIGGGGPAAGCGHGSLEYAQVDLQRERRCGFPEVIFSQGKTPAQVAGIAKEILHHNDVVLATRATNEVYRRLKKDHADATYNRPGRCVVIDRRRKIKPEGLVTVVTAGTADIPVAEEARTTAAVMGARVETVFDVGVAGIHRLFDRIETIREARILVVCAGMEGALASVVGGLVDRPVIAVPTSAGYGASFGGVAALLGMLNSCSANVTVVNIDNGFGAGYCSALINRASVREGGS